MAIVIVVGVLAWTAPIAAQPPAGLPEVALLCSRFCFETPDDLHVHFAGQALLRGLKSGGYVEGKDVLLSLRASGVGTDLARHAADLARRKPAVILAFQDDGIEAARRATSTTPIVMVGVNDAVARYELFLSESAARALGITIPESVRARADEVLP